MGGTSLDRVIRKHLIVSAAAREVWTTWTTREGVRTFFAPEANVDLRIGGPYEMLFDADAPVGSQGGEGLRILSYLPQEMLSFEWNAPAAYPAVRQEKTWVIVQLQPLGAGSTGVALTHLGWQKSREWDQVYDYFVRAWEVVLGRLQYRFSVGPIDWSDPYRPPRA